MRDKVNYHDVDQVGDAMHFLREPLGCDQLGVTVVECAPGWTGKEHDHSEQGEEEVYLLLDGNATVTVDREAQSASGREERSSSGNRPTAGDSQTPPASGDTESTFVLAGAP